MSCSSVIDIGNLTSTAPMPSLTTVSSDDEFDDAIRQALGEQGVQEDQRTQFCHVVQMDHDYALRKHFSIDYRVIFPLESRVIQSNKYSNAMTCFNEISCFLIS